MVVSAFENTANLVQRGCRISNLLGMVSTIPEEPQNCHDVSATSNSSEAVFTLTTILD
jgi:hypothetical protein